MSELKTSCINPCCNAVAYIRENGRGDDYFTCSKCGPYNGKGKAFREWMENLRVSAEDQKMAAAEMQLRKAVSRADQVREIVAEPDVVEPEPVEEKAGDWLDEL